MRIFIAHESSQEWTAVYFWQIDEARRFVVTFIKGLFWPFRRHTLRREAVRFRRR